MVKRKDYTLFVFFRNIKVPIIKGTINEIDDFTTYFDSLDSLAKLYLKDFALNNNYSFYIESSRGNHYNILYNKHRFIINSDNKKNIIDIIKKLPIEYLIEYIENNTKIVEYMESEKRDSIPLYRLYTYLIDKNPNYHDLLTYMLESDYKFYRDISRFFKYEMQNLLSKPIEKAKKQEIQIKSDQIYYSICDMINNKNISKSYDYLENNNIEDDILDIINKYDSIDEIMTEIGFLIQDDEKREYYLGKYKSLIHGKLRNGKINR